MNYFFFIREYCIVYFLWYDSGNIDFRIGNVVELFIGNYGLEKRGLDFVLVKNYISRKEGIFFSGFFIFNCMNK